MKKIFNKKQKEENLKNFIDKTLPILIDNFPIKEFSNSKMFKIYTKHYEFDYYPQVFKCAKKLGPLKFQWSFITPDELLKGLIKNHNLSIDNKDLFDMDL